MLSCDDQRNIKLNFDSFIKLDSWKFKMKSSYMSKAVKFIKPAVLYMCVCINQQ